MSFTNQFDFNIINIIIYDRTVKNINGNQAFSVHSVASLATNKIVKIYFLSSLVLFQADFCMPLE